MKSLGFLLLVLVNLIHCQDYNEMIVLTLQGILQRLDGIDSEIKALKMELKTEIEEKIPGLKMELKTEIEEKIPALKMELKTEIEEKIPALKMELKTEMEDKIKGSKLEYEAQNNNTRTEVATLMDLLNTDECLEMTHNCSSSASCIDTSLSFRCQCKPGFTGDGYTCKDEDECALGTHNCREYAVCSNTEGSFKCQCTIFYEVDGVNCHEFKTPSCESPFTAVRGVGCIHIIERKQSYERSRESCKGIGGDLFVAINPQHYLRLAQHFIETKQAAKARHMWVGVEEGVWLNGRKVASEEEAPGNPNMGSGTCSYTDGDTKEKFLLWTDPCSRDDWWALCEKKN